HDRRAIMRVTFAIHAVPEADGSEQLDRTGFEGAGTNAMQHMLSRLPFQYDAIDAVSVEDVRQQQPGGPAANDRHLGSHAPPPAHVKVRIVAIQYVEGR